MKNREEYLKKFNRMVYEYTTPASTMSEDAPADPNAMAAPAADPAAMGMDPNAMAADPNAMAMQDPAAMGMDPNAMAAPAADPNAMATPQDPGAPGFTPQQQPAEDPAAQAQQPAPQDVAPAEQAPDVSDDIESLKDDTQKSLDSLTGKFEDLLAKFDAALVKIDDTDAKIAQLSAQVKDMNPTPEQKMTIRSLEGKPYSETPEQFWQEKEETSNYSPEPDNNGEDMPQYQIKKSDVDSMNDWKSISKSFEDERVGLTDIFGY